MSKRIFEIIQDINGRVGFQWDDEDKQELAELIVQECQNRVEQYIRDCRDISSLPDTVIMKHFGVEE